MTNCQCQIEMPDVQKNKVQLLLFPPLFTLGGPRPPAFYASDIYISAKPYTTERVKYLIVTRDNFFNFISDVLQDYITLHIIS